MKLIKPTFFVAIAMIALTGMFGCVSVDANGKVSLAGMNDVKASGKIVSKTIKTGAIKTITLNSVPDLIITQGNTPKVTIKASDNIIPYCQVKNTGGKLTISFSDNGNTRNFRNLDITVYVTVKELESVTSNGTGSVKFQGTTNVNSLNLSVNGTGDINLPLFSGNELRASVAGTGDISINGKTSFAKLSVSGTGDINAKLTNVNELFASVSGTGDITVKGSTTSANLSVSGTGDVYARDLIAKNVKASTSGMGDITCYASESFNAKRSGHSNITCYGKPKNRNFNTEGYSFPE